MYTHLSLSLSATLQVFHLSSLDFVQDSPVATLAASLREGQPVRFVPNGLSLANLAQLQAELIKRGWKSHGKPMANPRKSLKMKVSMGKSSNSREVLIWYYWENQVMVDFPARHA